MVVQAKYDIQCRTKCLCITIKVSHLTFSPLFDSSLYLHSSTFITRSQTKVKQVQTKRILWKSAIIVEHHFMRNKLWGSHKATMKIWDVYFHDHLLLKMYINDIVILKTSIHLKTNKILNYIFPQHLNFPKNTLKKKFQILPLPLPVF